MFLNFKWLDFRSHCIQFEKRNTVGIQILTKLVQCSNGPKLSGYWMVRYLNAIWIPDHFPDGIPNCIQNVCHFGCLPCKFRRSGVPTQDSFSRRILKVCVLSRVEARFWNPKIVFIRSMNTSPVPKWLNTKVSTTRLSSFFRVAKRGRVIRQNLLLRISSSKNFRC